MKPSNCTNSALLWVLLCIGVAGCADDEPENREALSSSQSEQLQEHFASAHVEVLIAQFTESPVASQSSVSEPPTFCEFVYEYDGGFGEYEVVEIVETLERNRETERTAPWTYATLRAIGPHAEHSPGLVTLRTNGGPLGEDSWLSIGTSFELGETVFLFYVHARDGLNAGFATPFDHLVFRGAPDRGYQSTWYFTGDPRSAEEIFELATRVVDEFGHQIHELPYSGSGFDIERCPASTIEVERVVERPRPVDDGVVREVETTRPE